MRTKLLAISISVYIYCYGVFPLITTGDFGYFNSLCLEQVSEAPVLTLSQSNMEEQKKLLSRQQASDISPMEGLDLIQKKFAANFTKEYTETKESYYYKLPIAEYYLVYEGVGESISEYLFHLYEYVLDEPGEGIGHIVTYGWYTVDKYTGDITDVTQ